MEFSNKIITCPAKLTETIAKMKKRRHGILQARILEWIAYPFPGGLPDPGIKPGSPALQVDSLPTELSGKPPNVLKPVIKSC